MFEISYDESVFNEYCQNNYVYKGSQYVFTFDDRFIVYYYKRCDRYIYIAVDTKTGLGSEFASTTYKYKKNEYDTLIPKIIGAVKYTGELKYLTATFIQNQKTEENITE